MKFQNNLIKEKKIEKTNPCFRRSGDSIRKKKTGVDDKKSIFKETRNFSFFFFFWDKEKKLISFIEKKKNLSLDIFLSKRGYLFIEEFLIQNYNQYVINYGGSSSEKNFSFFFSKCNLEFSDLLFFLMTNTSNLSVHRFGLKNSSLLKPKFLCLPKKKNEKSLFSFLNYKQFSCPYPSVLLCLTVIKLKPGLLKFIISGRSCILIFSIEIGFHSACPVLFFRLFEKKSRKKKKS